MSDSAPPEARDGIVRAAHVLGACVLLASSGRVLTQFGNGDFSVIVAPVLLVAGAVVWARQ